MLRCHQCQARLNRDLFNAGAMGRCPACNARVQAAVFPALFRDIRPGAASETILEADTAGCFYHPSKKAVVACDGCGRFLCALCDVQLVKRHLCPACLQAGRRDRSIATLENRRVLYDSAMLALALWPLLLFYVTLVTAPLAILLTFRFWKRPGSLVPRTKVRYVLALLAAGLQVVGWTVFFVS